MTDKSEGSRVAWRKFDGRRHVAADMILICCGIVACFAIGLSMAGNTFTAVIWSLVLCLYFMFYRRIVQVIYWSWDTLGLISQFPGDARHSDDSAASAGTVADSPAFHILIAAYNAAGSIGPVIRAVANQNYPKDRYHAWIICEHSEQLKANANTDSLLRAALSGERNSSTDSWLLPFYWCCGRDEHRTLESFVTSITSGARRGYLQHRDMWEHVLEELLLLLLRTDECLRPGAIGMIKPLGLSRNEIRAIESAVHSVERQAQRAAEDFARLFGSDQIWLKADLEAEFARSVVRSGRMRRIGKGICRRLWSPEAEIVIPPREAIERTARRMNVSTQEAARRTIQDLPDANIHLLDPYGRGFKPGALNVAYREIRERGVLEHPEEVYFLIIDSDSLLPPHALDATAREVRRDDQACCIMQMASIPTANFFVRGWFSKFVSFCDAIGAMGKWARSTRRQLRPDLHAGSGVVVPATLTEFLSRVADNPWDESTLTEDARLIISHYGMMNGARNKTKMVPVYLLEAVPNGQTFGSTYQSFWNQRQRWTVGGFDEFGHVLFAPGAVRSTRFSAERKRWEPCESRLGGGLASRFRQFKRLGTWTWDHFWWGIGGFVVLTHWWLVSFAVGVPGAVIARIALAALLLAPLGFLLTSGLRLSPFVPGGLSRRRLCFLYCQSFFAIWLYCLPVVVTQCACLLGLKRGFHEWKPTQKPRYEVDALPAFQETAK